MRTTVDLPDDLMRRAKALAALKGMKLKDLIAACLEAGLKQDAGQKIVRERRKLPSQVRKATGKPIPALSNTELERILISGDV